MRELLGQPRLRQLFLAMAATLDQPLPRYRHERLEAGLSHLAVREQLAPMLIAGQHPDAQELAARAWTAVAPLVQLSPDEAAYFAAIDEGDLRLELLFPEEPAEAARLTEHPALQWKLANLGRRPKKRGGSREA